MNASTLLHDLVEDAAQATPEATALRHGGTTRAYGDLALDVRRFAGALVALGLERAARVGLFLDKRVETVVASFGVTAAGGVLVPINPLLKAEQVAYILRDCNVRVLVTSPERLAALAEVLGRCPDLQAIVRVDGVAPVPSEPIDALRVVGWQELLAGAAAPPHRVVDADMAAILYTSGSTGNPKGVVLSHRNMVAGAKSVAQYLQNRPDDVLLAALPLSFDAGFSQLTTAFHAGARVVLLNYLMPRDVIKAVEGERVTGLTAVPPLYIQLAALEWPLAAQESLRYIANTGGRMPRETLALLRRRLPRTAPFLMYGLTEAFRSTYLPPDQVDDRPDSIGRAIPNAEILVLREDGSECDADEPGELVHRGALVSLGYWNDAAKTAERFRPVPAGVGGRHAEMQLPEIAVFSGDTVRRDREGFLYFIGRRDEMIKTSGYRVSPTEVEEVLYSTRLVGECAAFGVEHPVWGQAIQVVATPAASDDALDIEALLTACRSRMPAYMVPFGVDRVAGPLPRNPNGKIDRKLLSVQWLERQP